MNKSAVIGDGMYHKLREQLPSLPEDMSALELRASIRDMQIYEDVLENGMTYASLGDELGISAQRIYQIVHKVAAAIRRRCPDYSKISIEGQ